MESKVVAGRYQTVRIIGEGGFGTVFEAVHVVSKKRVALKVLEPSSVKDEDNRMRFLREASAPEQIQHEGIVEIFDAGFDEDGSPFVAMELLEGKTLSDRMHEGALSAPEFFSVFARLLDPLAAAHRRGIVHRDLKPENVFLQRRPDGSERLKLLDFGIARDSGAPPTKMTKTGIMMGTPHYMSPEQAMSAKGVLASSDIWSIGCMMYEVLAGFVPFDGETISAVVVKMCTEAHRSIAEVAPSTPPQLAQLVDRCLSKDPNARARDASVLLDELRAVATSLGIALPTSVNAAPLPSGPGASMGAQLALGQPSQLGASGAFGAPQSGFGAPHSSFGAQPSQSGPAGAFGISGGFGAQPSQSGNAGSFNAPASGFGAPASGYGAPIPSGNFGPSSVGGAQSFGAMPSHGTLAAESQKSKSLLKFGVLAGLVLVCGLFVGVGYLVDGMNDTPVLTNSNPGVVPGTVVVPSAAAGPGAGPQQDAVQTFPGELADGDRTLQSGEWQDTYSVPFANGQRFRARAVSEAFDTYLIVRSPAGKSHDNDDASPNDRSAQLDIDVDEVGAWQIIVTSFAPGQKGNYVLTVERLPPATH